MQWFLDADYHVFHVINSKWTNAFFDKLMPWVTNWNNTWWVLLILVILWILALRMKAVKILLGCVLAVALSDSANHRIVKPLVKRDRPEMTLGKDHIRLLVPSATSYSFPSNHAANAFSVASYISFLHPAAAVVVYPIAWLVAYSRVYVGVHFPSDIIAGALFGVLYAVIARRLIIAVAVLIGARKTRSN